MNNLSDKEILRFFANLDDKQAQEILLKRFGLLGLPKKTLRDLAIEYRLSPETIRKIQIRSLNSLKQIKHKPFTYERQDIFFQSDFESNNYSKFYFEFESCDGIWTDKKFFREKIFFSQKETYQKISQIMLDCFNDNDGDFLELEKFVFDLKQKMDLSHISISKSKLEKLVLKSQFVSQNKKTSLFYKGSKSFKTADLICFYLKKQKEPIHYKEIFNNLRFKYQLNISLGSFHNILIKDKRFILVGRGFYTLRDASLFSNLDIKALIIKILKSGKKLKAHEIAAEILKYKIVKRESIYTILYSNKVFLRNKNGLFYLKK